MNLNKKICVGSLSLLMALSTFSGCSNDKKSEEQVYNSDLLKKIINVDYTDRDLENNCDEDVVITLKGNTIECDNDNVKFSDKKVIISKEGTYKLSGSLDDAQIVVNVGKEDKVQLLLDNANVNCSFGPAIYSDSADKIFITTAKGSENKISDDKNYTYKDDQPYGAIFATCGITLNGQGKLQVSGNYNNGIVSKDDLKITGGSIEVDALNNGIKGVDSVAIKDGTVNIKSQGDALKSNKSDNDNKGYVSVEGGNVNITSEKDGISAENIVQIIGGKQNITTGGGYEKTEKKSDRKEFSFNKSSDSGENSDKVSSKGIKGTKYVLVNGGQMVVNSADDAFHTNGSLAFDKGKASIQSGDDGMHADSVLEIVGGSVEVRNSYEGIEATQIKVNDGNISVVASDDGFNAAGGNDNSGMKGPMNNDNPPNMNDKNNKSSDGNKPTPPDMNNGDKQMSDGDMPTSPDMGNGDKQTLDGNMPTPPDMNGENMTPPQNDGEQSVPKEKDQQDNDAQVDNVSAQAKQQTTDTEQNSGANQAANDDSSSDKVDSSLEPKIEINGGKITIDAQGDGIDSNKDVVVTGGEVYVNGPTNGGNGALDCGEESGGKATISGGTVIAVGSPGMAVGFDNSSKQCSLMCDMQGSKGEVVTLADSSGKKLASFTATKTFQNIVISTPEMKKGQKYKLTVGEKTQEFELTDISTNKSEAVGMPKSGGLKKNEEVK